ncbi:MAG: iron chelate uptake ABC transporter family permease subunit, partial [Bdellovibrionales bacterium]|nr:iron chelate uptake ABC transporter family permease subunit [Bdellovibrionales bacterium]
MDSVRLGSFYCGVYACGFVLFSILALVSLNIGTQGTLITPLSDAALSKEQLFILYQIRLPRLILAFAAGSILALSGLTYQSLFANPIASPYTLGVSGGSAVGFVVANSFLGIHIPSQYSWIFSAIGGGVTLLFLYPLLRMRSNRSNQV